jgi:hypothetical protein
VADEAARDFASLMSSAAKTADAEAPADPAPFGYMTDPLTGETRPKKRPGRQPKKPPEPPPADTAAASAPPGGDPPPAWAGGQGDEKRPKLTIEQVPQQVVNDIAGLGGLIATPILALAQQLDPYCGGALAASFGDVLDATLPVICRSEKIVRYFSEDQADWLLWGKIAMAAAPVAKAIAEHHIFRTVQVVRDEKTGQVSVVRTRPGPQGGGNLQPPAQPEYDESQYAA